MADIEVTERYTGGHELSNAKTVAASLSDGSDITVKFDMAPGEDSDPTVSFTSCGELVYLNAEALRDLAGLCHDLADALDEREA